MSRWILAASASFLLSAVPATAVVSNGFDSDRIYALDGGANAPTDLLLSHSKLTGISPADNWTEMGIPQNTATSGTFFGHQFISLTFACAPMARANTPAGYRLFYLGRERAPDFDTYRPILVEVDSSCNELREAYIGRIVCGDKNFLGYNVQNWPRPNLRYNATNNTLMVGISHDGVGTGAILHGYIYEFTLPGSPVGTGVGSPDELQGITLMETYDTGIIGVNANDGFNINVSPDGTLYFRNPSTDLYSFSTAGGSTPGGTTSNPTPVVTSATLTAAVGNGFGQWQSAIYRPVSNSLVNLQRRTSPNPPIPAMVNYALTTHAATVIPGSVGMRGQHNGSLDVATGDIWIVCQNPPNENGGVWNYTAGDPPVLIHWDTLSLNDGGRMLFDIAVPPPCLAACCTPAGGCEILPQEQCAAVDGVWHGADTICDSTRCCPVPFADKDGDGDVDQEDFAVFQTCVTIGIAGGGITAGCECFNRDGDTDIDQLDFEAFQACATGPMIHFDSLSPPPGCIP